MTYLYHTRKFHSFPLTFTKCLLKRRSLRQKKESLVSLLLQLNQVIRVNLTLKTHKKGNPDHHSQRRRVLALKLKNLWKNFNKKMKIINLKEKSLLKNFIKLSPNNQRSDSSSIVIMLAEKELMTL
jgi:hypothetical protein